LDVKVKLADYPRKARAGVALDGNGGMGAHVASIIRESDAVAIKNLSRLLLTVPCFRC
jgi:hypothetical protein